MDATTSTGKLVIALRQELRTKGLHYRDVAARLGVSEGTVKRYFRGKGLSLPVLEKLVGVLDLDLLSLMVMAQQQNKTEPGLSKGQRAALSKSRVAFMVFHFLSIGLTPAQIVREFDLHDQMNGILTQLQDFGLIRRLANGGAKTLVRPVLEEKLASQVAYRKMQKANVTRRFLTKIDFQNERCEWINSVARLSPESAAHLRELMDRFSRDVLAMTKSDISRSPEATQWYRLVLLANPVSRRRMVDEI
jgi:transcriptional regulator with XRE-family HTH domain